jgi:hypothetical protein
MPSAGAISPSTSASEALPPAPCAIVMRSSRKRSGFARTRSISSSASRSSRTSV